MTDERFMEKFVSYTLLFLDLLKEQQIGNEEITLTLDMHGEKKYERLCKLQDEINRKSKFFKIISIEKVSEQKFEYRVKSKPEFFSFDIPKY